MKKSKNSTVLWFILSFVFLLGTVTAISVGLTGRAITLVDASVLEESSRQMLECARSGDFDALGEMLYGSPRLGTPCGDGNGAEDVLWNAYLRSIQYQFPGTYTQSGGSMELDTQIDCLDLAAVLERMNALTTDSGDSAEAALRDTAARVLAESAPTMHRELKLTLVRGERGWQVVPTPQLQQLLSGFLTE